MRILQVISALNKAAGTTTFVENVVLHLRLLGHDVDVLTKSDYQKDSLWRNRHYDIVHIHTIWPPWLHRVSVWAHRRGIPVVWSTHGMTAPWSMRHKRWKKYIPWFLYQKKDLTEADLIHSTSQQEVEWNQTLGLSCNVIVPLGATLPEEVTPLASNSLLRRFLFVGRIYPVKGLMNVVLAAAMARDLPARFRIVGPDQAGHMEELKKKAISLGVESMFEFVGPKYDENLSREYDCCDVVMLPSFTENFGATVVDALAHARPALAGANTPWRILEERVCGWWVDNSPETLACAFRKICDLSRADLTDMGLRGRQLAEEKYSWSSIAKTLDRMYLDLTRGCEKGCGVSGSELHDTCSP